MNEEPLRFDIPSLLTWILDFKHGSFLVIQHYIPTPTTTATKKSKENTLRDKKSSARQILDLCLC